MVNWQRHWQNRLNRLRYWSTSYPFLVERRKKRYLSSNSLSFPVEGFVFQVKVRSRVSIICQALNTPTASELINPQLDQSRLLFGFFGFRCQKPINKEFYFIYEQENTQIYLFTYLSFPKSSHSFLGALNLHLHILQCTFVIHPSLKLYLSHC